MIAQSNRCVFADRKRATNRYTKYWLLFTYVNLNICSWNLTIIPWFSNYSCYIIITHIKSILYIYYYFVFFFHNSQYTIYNYTHILFYLIFKFTVDDSEKTLYTRGHTKPAHISLRTLIYLWFSIAHYSLIKGAIFSTIRLSVLESHDRKLRACTSTECFFRDWDNIIWRFIAEIAQSLIGNVAAEETPS